MRPTSLVAGEALTWPIHVISTTGALVDADSTPTVAIRRGGAAVGDSVTVTKRAATTGIYDCSYTPASTTANELIEVTETVVVSTVSYVNAWQFAIRDELLLVTNHVPAGQAAVIIPDPGDDAAVCTVYVNSEDILNALAEGVIVTFELRGGPAKSERLLTAATSATMTTNASGYAAVTLQRNDQLTPSDTYYHVTCDEFGLYRKVMTLTAATFNLADLVS